MSNAFFAALSLFLYLDAQCPFNGSISHTDPFAVSPDLRDARSLVRTEQRQYTGALRYDKKDGAPYRLTSASDRQYFGNPSTTPSIDHSWKELLQNEFFALSPAEAKPYIEKGLAKPSPSNKYYAELGVFHNLRCLNTIRIYLDAEYYREHGVPEGFDAPRGLDRAKIDYCLDHLRQSVQCSADLTVVPMLAQDAWTGSDNVLSQPRTCRKWEDVRSWLDRRHERTMLKEQHAAYELV
ncbi:uncharacterized protein K452DRAFT_233901 [Aplosporella prunicola CBS 121167]|uniref:Uncharacterized protein n=1 Tax=Aplosporella prunicola CBS 121167 TaxID=1176127 RepID=A0A6A6B523_9PEZI|nr:uncharacterized protein K452DRAFT_233901 [Aplosporella prunicola CBS 121167]KAF2138513.1 hypothetical protein K452DRAFT_233901 [Aplosporella prunicola CBS 121167]